MTDFQEFDTEENKSNIADAVQKNIAGIIDGVLVIGLNNIFFLFFPDIFKYFKIDHLIGFIVFNYFITFLIYRITTIFIFKRTIGMLLQKIEFSKANDSKLNFSERILTVFMVYINGIDCYTIVSK